MRSARPSTDELWHEAVDATLSFHGDPAGLADAVLGQAPEHVMAYLLKAYLAAFALDPRFGTAARRSLAAAVALRDRADERERLHMAALRAWLDGELDRAAETLGGIVECWPHDAVALMFAHQADFFTSAEEALLERPSRALAHWHRDEWGYGYILGMRAFGLEEAARYDEALALAEEACGAEPRNAWAVHAGAHVHEMRGGDEAGLAWYERYRRDWAEDCFFAVHNHWHRALYHVDLDDAPAALAVWDEGLKPDSDAIALNLADAASLLWRLGLAGHDVGERWEHVVGLFIEAADGPLHVFPAVHLVMALAGAGRDREAQATIDRLAGDARGSDRNAWMLRSVGVPIARGFLSYARGRYGEARETLSTAMPDAAFMTGSRAQRDVVVMTLIEAAIRCGDYTLARRLLRQRLEAKPTSVRAARDLGRAGG